MSLSSDRLTAASSGTTQHLLKQIVATLVTSKQIERDRQDVPSGNGTDINTTYYNSYTAMYK